MNVTLPAELERLVNEKVENGEFESADAFVAHAIRESLGVNSHPEAGAETETLWDAFERILRDVSEDQVRKLPNDFATEHDHYI